MPKIFRRLLGLDTKPVDELAAMLIMNDHRLNLSKDGVVSLKLDDPEVQEDLRKLIEDFKSVKTELPRRANPA
ncbi:MULTISPECIES: hypothetical protein [Aeromonas]|uniref:hypothetical protein n=1 Tax=Aeromonas TaxID=642 RepID=UPI0004935A24|nr:MULTISPECIES: hypothetical protein [Aeromonas]EJN6957987.1 hypothetical protein [Aeromonas hydrophila]KER62592.1 hypothetical protein HR52_06100 [Aeromonas hydrophila]KHE16641.1 hypothetical protein OI71_02520 [Aeromonas hydrophila]KWR69383.1 hypothetical protein ATO50_09510 [Aeromonas hydrophila]MBL0561394.1 hypothetical protein [Aeromonas hydrophila]